MQLVVLGPAFGLPSIDAECNATIKLLEVQGEKVETINASDDREGVPRLLATDDRGINGFRSIARSTGVDSSLSPANRGDSIAISSFIEAHAQILLDVSLYMSFDNYSVTRSAFTNILPWYTNFMLPPRRRAAARARTEHLGISSIDVDNVHDDLSGRPSGMDGVGKEEPAFEVEAQKRASLLLPRRNTIKSMLQRPEHSAVFKLHALADKFFGPMTDMLGEKAYLLSDSISSVDYLAYGYLSLMLYPKFPQYWLAETMRRKYGTLVEYIERIHSLDTTS